MSLGEADTGGDGRTKASLRSALQLWQLQQGEDGRSACSASYGGGDKGCQSSVVCRESEVSQYMHVSEDNAIVIPHCRKSDSGPMTNGERPSDSARVRKLESSISMSDIQGR